MGRSRSRSASKSKSRSHSRSKSRSRSWSKSRSRSRSYSRSYSRSRSRSRSPRRRSYSRSRSRSYSRSRSRSPYARKHGGYRGSRSYQSSYNRKRHVGSRDNPPEGKCLGVFGLSLYTTEREVRELFEKYGQVDDCQVVYDHATGRSRGFAFIYLHSVDEAAEAKERLNGAELDGRRIRVDYSITQRAHTPTPGVYMGKPSQHRNRNDRYRGDRYSNRDDDRYHRSHKSRSRSHSRSRSRSPRRW